MREIIPFVKWAGGKRQILSEIRNRLPKFYTDYYEPFVGGGAVLFALQPKRAIINDINRALITTYFQIKNNPQKVIEKLDEMDSQYCTKEQYYRLRNKYNSKLKLEEYDVEMASLFIFLNKRCFNGLYRVNSGGMFNVPFNGKEIGKSYSKENILEASEFLRGVSIINGDFESATIGAKKGDFVFFDSPYMPLKSDTFEAYTKEGFTRDDHVRLAKLFKKLDKRGCFVMLTNHNTQLMRELYEEYYIDEVSVKRLINRDATARVGEEVIVRNYFN